MYIYVIYIYTHVWRIIHIGVFVFSFVLGEGVKPGNRWRRAVHACVRASTRFASPGCAQPNRSPRFTPSYLVDFASLLSLLVRSYVSFPVGWMRSSESKVVKVRSSESRWHQVRSRESNSVHASPSEMSVKSQVTAWWSSQWIKVTLSSTYESVDKLDYTDLIHFCTRGARICVAEPK